MQNVDEMPHSAKFKLQRVSSCRVRNAVRCIHCVTNRPFAEMIFVTVSSVKLYSLKVVFQEASTMLIIACLVQLKLFH